MSRTNKQTRSRNMVHDDSDEDSSSEITPTDKILLKKKDIKNSETDNSDECNVHSSDESDDVPIQKNAKKPVNKSIENPSNKLITKLTNNFGKVENLIKKLLRENKDLKEKVDRILTDNITTINRLEKMNEKLNNCFIKSVLNNTDTEMTKIIVLFKNNSDDLNDFAYTMLDIYAKSANELIQNYLNNNSNSEIITILKFELNSDLYTKIKDILKSKTNWKHKSFDLINNYTEEQLIKDIKKIELEEN